MHCQHDRCDSVVGLSSVVPGGDAFAVRQAEKSVVKKVFGGKRGNTFAQGEEVHPLNGLTMEL